jgi:hypothetical protein
MSSSHSVITNKWSGMKHYADGADYCKKAAGTSSMIEAPQQKNINEFAFN